MPYNQSGYAAADYFAGDYTASGYFAEDYNVSDSVVVDPPRPAKSSSRGVNRKLNEVEYLFIEEIEEKPTLKARKKIAKRINPFTPPLTVLLPDLKTEIKAPAKRAPHPTDEEAIALLLLS